MYFNRQFRYYRLQQVFNRYFRFRYPQNGTLVEAYCFAHFLHPFYRGCLLYNFEDVWTNAQEAFISQNEVTPDPDVIHVPVDEDVAPDDDEDDFFTAIPQVHPEYGGKANSRRKEGRRFDTSEN